LTGAVILPYDSQRIHHIGSLCPVRKQTHHPKPSISILRAIALFVRVAVAILKGSAKMKLTQARFLAAVLSAVVVMFSDFAHAQTKPSASLVTVYKTAT